MEINITLLKKMGYYVATAAEAFRAYVIPTRYVEGYYLSGDDIHSEASGINKLTGADAHAWVEVYFDGVGWLPLDVTPGYYYDAVSLQQMIGMPEQASKNAALEDPSFGANQVASGYSLSWDLEIGRILDYEWMHRKFAQADQLKKVRIYGEVDQKIHENYQRVEAGAYLRACEILEKSIYGQQNLEPYEMRTVSAFMKKLEVIGGNTLNRRERIELRYGYVVRIMEKIRRKTGQKGKTKKNSRKELTK